MCVCMCAYACACMCTCVKAPIHVNTHRFIAILKFGKRFEDQADLILKLHLGLGTTLFDSKNPLGKVLARYRLRSRRLVIAVS